MKKELYSALGLTDHEYSEIARQIGREPNEMETYLFSAMWSEHCGYSHSRKYLKRFPKEGSLHSEENAGGVQIGDHVIFFKAESHNHPSAVEPFQGAATGIGGIIRDVLALGARPIALLDSLKFGRINEGEKSNHSKHLFSGVVKGISAYGNSIGVPTVAGEVGYDACYETSPLVNVMAVGIVNKNEIKISSAPVGQHVVIVGSHTGRDGIHGASFASKELSDKSKEDRPSVQVGDPFIKKILIEATLEILRLDETLACQDCGAAGLLSSTSEMAYKGGCGMELYLDKVHLRENGMRPWEIMLSESQERMIFVTTAEGVKKVMAIADKYEIPAREIGRTIPEEEYRLFWNGELVANVPPAILNNGILYDLNEKEPKYVQEYRKKKLKGTIGTEEAVRRVVKDPNFASKGWVFTQYDHTVGNRTAVTPNKAGAAGMWLPEEGGVLGLTIDSNGRQVFLDPYNGSKNTLYEAWRNLVSSGYKVLGITDCLNYGNPEKDEVGYQLVRSIDGLADGCRELRIPVVSGNVSLYNECESVRVYPTPTVGAVGYTASPNDLLRSSFSAGETLYLLGKEMTDDSAVGGSLYQMVCFDFLGGPVDTADPQLEHLLAETIFELRDKKLIKGAADVSEGGLLGAVLEGLFNGGCGFKGDLIVNTEPLKALFGEITGRYVVSTSDPKGFEKHCRAPYRRLGKCGGGEIIFDGMRFDLSELKDLYENSIERDIST